MDDEAYIEARERAFDNGIVFEGVLKGHSRTSKRGRKVSFLVHEEDVTKGVENMEINARYKVVAFEIGDDEQPVPQPAQEAKSESTLNSGDNRPASGEGIPPTRVRTLPEYIGMRCNQPPFQQWCLDYEGVKGIVDPIAKRKWTAQYVREICRVKSRSEILPGTEAEGKWKWLESAFLLEGHV